MAAAVVADSSFLVTIGFTNLDFNFSNSSGESFFPATPRGPCFPSGSNFLIAAVASLVHGNGFPPKIDMEFLCYKMQRKIIYKLFVNTWID